MPLVHLGRPRQFCLWGASSPPSSGGVMFCPWRAANGPCRYRLDQSALHSRPVDDGTEAKPPKITKYILDTQRFHPSLLNDEFKHRWIEQTKSAQIKPKDYIILTFGQTFPMKAPWHIGFFLIVWTAGSMILGPWLILSYSSQISMHIQQAPLMN